VTSSAEGPCSAPPLTSDGPGSACDRAGTTTYELGESLGVVTPTSVTLDGQGAGQTVDAEFDKADASKLGDVTGKALEKQLAILLGGKVLSAPVVKEPLTGGKVAFTFGTAAEAEQVATELGASATSWRRPLGQAVRPRPAHPRAQWPGRHKWQPHPGPPPPPRHT
jgi:hypothetical protein